VAALGEAFLLRKPGQQIEHLWVLITKADPTSGEAIMVNITTRRAHSDATTILNVGDHRFIKNESVVYYADARLVDPANLDAAVARGAGSAHASFSPAVLARIQAGVEGSRQTPKKIKEAFRAAMRAGLV
jgi:hypothetical protein